MKRIVSTFFLLIVLFCAAVLTACTQTSPGSDNRDVTSGVSAFDLKDDRAEKVNLLRISKYPYAVEVRNPMLIASMIQELRQMKLSYTGESNKGWYSSTYKVSLLIEDGTEREEVLTFSFVVRRERQNTLYYSTQDNLVEEGHEYFATYTFENGDAAYEIAEAVMVMAHDSAGMTVVDERDG